MLEGCRGKHFFDTQLKEDPEPRPVAESSRGKWRYPAHRCAGRFPCRLAHVRAGRAIHRRKRNQKDEQTASRRKSFTVRPKALRIALPAAADMMHPTVTPMYTVAAMRRRSASELPSVSGEKFKSPKRHLQSAHQLSPREYRDAFKLGLIHSWCRPWRQGEANPPEIA